MIRMKISLLLPLLLALGGLNSATAQLASFSFGGPSTVSGWTNLSGDPYSAAQTATVSGITISSISPANWAPNSVPSCEYNFGGASSGVYFPANVMVNSWLQWNGNSYDLALYNALLPQLQLSGLNKDSTYIIRMSGSDKYYTGSTQYTVAGANLSGSQYLNTYNNTTQGVTFEHVQPDSSGTIRIYVSATSSSYFAFISGVQVFPGSANVGTPVVALTAPVNGTVQSEGGNFILTATASETGGTIAKVQFYADTTLIAEVDAAPYTFTWVDPDPGSYQITAMATDAVGTIATASVNVGVQSLNYFWSTTGNIATGGDTSFVGTVDSNRLTFRTKNIERMTISAIGNVGIGTDSPTAQLHTTGTVRLAGIGSDSSNIQPRMLVSDSSGNLYYRSIATGGLNAGPGLGQTSTGIAIGDSIPGPGPHSFNSNRYQYLNGYQYSIGGTVNDPVNHPNFRIYDNGDLAAGTTMDRSVNTTAQIGMRYYAKMNYLQIGASDRIDTARSNIVYDGLPTSGIFINSDDSNSINANVMNTVVACDLCLIDSGLWMENNFITGERLHFTGPTNTYIRSFIGGYANLLSASADACLIDGFNMTLSKAMIGGVVTGFENVTQDSVWLSFVGGAYNQFGGRAQLVQGQYLVNRTPLGTTLGNANVDFSTLSYTGTKGTTAPGIAGYPLFALGNSADNTGTTRSNAITVLYNGRTQINTTGHTNTLTQAQVTPAAALDVVSTNTGVLLPRLNTSQRNAIVSGDLQNGLLLYNTDSSVFQYYNGSAWNSVGSGNAGSGRWLFSAGTVYDSADNIGIGTSNTQGYKLAVNGTAIFTKVKVKTAGTWPDYVFKKGYSLPGLEELEKYVIEHHHLPGIASEQEVQRDGVDLADQQAALLKKVEELTLYLIRENRLVTEQNQRTSDQSKEIDEQKRQLAEQNARLEAQQKEIDELKALIQSKK